jgi:hypothetical protein
VTTETDENATMHGHMLHCIAGATLDIPHPLRGMPYWRDCIILLQDAEDAHQATNKSHSQDYG